MNIRLQSPKNVSQTRLTDYLTAFEPVFIGSKQFQNMEFDFSKVKSISLLGQMLVYKTLEWNAFKNRYERATLTLSKNMRTELKKTGMHYYLKPMLKGSIRKWFGHHDNKLKTEITDNFIIYPVFVSREDKYDKQLSVLLDRLESFYSFNPHIIHILGIVISEIYGNFSSHAIDDERTIMAARGNNQYVEFGFVDNGQGIVSSLKHAGVVTHKKPISRSIEQGVTSKEGTDHIGYGLWHVSRICQTTNSQLIICSEGSSLSLSRKLDFVEKNVGFWKGTILYVRLNITDLTESTFPSAKLHE